MIWWAKDPDRLKREVGEVELLRERWDWLSMATPRLRDGLNFAFDFDVTLDGEIFALRLEYPAFFPETPPSVVPRDGRRLSQHQYGSGGELCLEFRSDNWDPAITGAMMIESAYRLLVGERLSAEGDSIVPSAHSASLGQELRGWNSRFLVTHGFAAHVAQMPVGEFRDATISDGLAPKETWVAYVRSIGAAEAPDWRETGIPDRGDRGEPGLVLRVASLAGLPARPDQGALDRMIAEADGRNLLSPTEGQQRLFFIVITDGRTARMFCSYARDMAWNVIPYQTVDLADDVDMRLPPDNGVLGRKKVGIVGCGSLGSKIAASLARSGIREFVLVDDDILKPGNLVRHDLDARSVAAHKADGMAARLAAVVAGTNISVRRVALGGPESSGTTASVLDELALCDLLIDATADPQAFNFVASVARSSLRPLVWAEVYAGGIGGFVARLRPGMEPPPHAARQQYLAWCRDQRVAWHGRDSAYCTHATGGTPLVADDADVAVIAAHASRMALDALIRPVNSAFPYAAYAIGLSARWIFEEPFDTRPITFSPAGEWQAEVSPERSAAAIQFMLSLFVRCDHAD